MLKKYSALLFLIIAYAILVGHNIIPHHHHEQDHDHEVTGQHDNHGSEEPTDFDHLFSYFNHSTESFSFTVNQKITTTFSKGQLFAVAMLPDNFALEEFLIPPLLGKPTSDYFICILPHFGSSGLRAPPATFI